MMKTEFLDTFKIVKICKTRGRYRRWTAQVGM